MYHSSDVDAFAAANITERVDDPFASQVNASLATARSSLQEMKTGQIHEKMRRRSRPHVAPDE